MIPRIALFIAIGSTTLLMACGQKGDLYLPPAPSTADPAHSPVTPTPASETRR